MTRNNLYTIIALMCSITAVSLGLIFSYDKPLNNLRYSNYRADVNNEKKILHYSTLMGKDFFDKAYAQMPPIVKTKKPIVGGTVNHHLLAAPLDAQFFSGLTTQNPKQIILIGPDHLSRGKKPITTTSGIWQTPYGQLITDTKLVTELAKKNLVNIEESPFDYEFSVGGLVPFIKKSLPKAIVTTIIVKDSTPIEQLESLAKALPTSKDAIVVASIDFSHYLPSSAAEFHDITNRKVINDFDYSNFNKLEIDSLPTLRVLLKYLELRHAQSSTLVSSTDSAKITGKLDTFETTSYLNQYFTTGEKIPLNVSTSLYLGGTKNINSPENRFMRGFMSFDDGKSIPPNLKKSNLAVGIAHYPEKTVYYLFPTKIESGKRQLMTNSEKTAYFRQNNIKESMLTIENNVTRD